MPQTIDLLFCVYPAFVVQITVTQRSLSACLGSPVQPPPRANREDVVDAPLYLRCTDGITGRRRPEAYHEAPTAHATRLWSVPMAPPCECDAVARERAAHGRAVRCRTEGESPRPPLCAYVCVCVCVCWGKITWGPWGGGGWHLCPSHPTPPQKGGGGGICAPVIRPLLKLSATSDALFLWAFSVATWGLAFKWRGRGGGGGGSIRLPRGPPSAYAASPP